MPRLDPMEKLRRADERWRKARDQEAAARQARKEAMVAASEAGVALYDIAGALGVGHEAVRKVVAADGRKVPYRRRTA